MEWNINENLPIWTQLCEQITAEITAGRYAPGTRLPSVRELAAEAGVNPNTMQRALSELESRGLLQTNRTAGRSVTADPARIQALRRQAAERQVEAFLQNMRKLGYKDREIDALFQEALSRAAEETKTEQSVEVLQ